MRNLVLFAGIMMSVLFSFGQDLGNMEEKYLHIQFNEIPSTEVRPSWEKLGIELLRYLPGKVYTAKVQSRALKTLELSSLVDNYFEISPAQKIHKNLAGQGVFPAWAFDEDGNVRVNVVLYDANDKPRATKELKRLGYNSWEGNNHNMIVSVRVPENELADVAALDFIRFIEAADPDPEPDNLTGGTLIRSNVIASSHPMGRHYNGEGIVIGHQDDGDIENDHPDWKNRVIHDAPASRGDHGDHIAGTLIGAGNRDPKGKGLAWGAKNYYRSVYALVNNMAVHYNRDSVLVTSTSYSNGCNDGYTAFAQQHDQQVVDFPGLMHVFSAGNSGRQNCGYGAGNNWGNITGGHKVGKNVIAVGNTNLNGGINSSSSRGPAEDGRIKPDVVAKGTDVYSTTDLDPSGYTFKTGTSMSCPMVSASLAQLYQAYREINNVTYPPSDLMKGVLLNSADDLGNTGPDFIYGWGQVNALRAVKIIENQQYFQDSASNAGSNNHTLAIPANVAQVKIMVYWNDVPAAVGASTALVNDLDMTVVSPANDTTFPYVLDHTPAGVQNPATRGHDHLNNMEQVVIDNPAAGNYDIEIFGNLVPQGPQKYWIVYDFIYDEITVTYPWGGERFDPSDREVIRWDAIDSPGSFIIEYSTDSGATWSRAGAVSGQLRFFNWNVVNVNTDQALIRVSKSGGPSDVSDHTFSIMTTPRNLRMIDVCQTRATLSWDSMPDASAYIVYELGNMYMDPVDTVTTASYTFSTLTTNQSNWYSVSAIGVNGGMGPRAIAITHLHTATNDCYPINLAVEEQISPLSTCFLGSMEEVAVTIKNQGINAIPQGTSFPIAYSVNNALADTQLYTLSNPLMPGMTFNVSFDSLLDASALGIYNIRAWVTIAGDGERLDDTLSFQVEKITPISTYPYIEDFESWSICGDVNECNINCETAVRGNWTQLKTDDQDFRVNNGPTPSNNTGPDRDSRPGTNSGKYIYAEASDGCDQQLFEIESPCFDLASLAYPTLAFDFHMYGANTGRMECLVSNDGGNSWNSVWVQLGQRQPNSSANWETVQRDLSTWNNDVILVKFVATTGGDFDSDMALDAFRVYDDTCQGSVSLPYQESFDGVNTPELPPCWVTNEPAAVFTTPGCSGSVQNSLQLDGSIGAYAETPPFDPAGFPDIKVSYRYRAGDDNSCGENPEANDAIAVQYWDGTSWVTAKIYLGSSTPQVFTPDSFSVPASALTGSFRVRFFMQVGNGVGFDNFNFDDVAIEGVCAPQRVNLGAFICEGDSYTLPNGNVVSAPGIYVDSLTTINGCDSIVSTNVQLLTVNTNVTWDGATLSAISNATNYQWIDCNTNQPIPGATSSTFTPTTSGDYAVLLTQGACTDTSECTNVMLVSIGETMGSFFRVYPNPSTGLYKVEISRDVTSIESFRVVDGLGRIILEVESPSWEMELNLNNQPDGYYFLEIESDEGFEVVKLVKN